MSASLRERVVELLLQVPLAQPGALRFGGARGFGNAPPLFVHPALYVEFELLLPRFECLAIPAQLQFDLLELLDLRLLALQLPGHFGPRGRGQRRRLRGGLLLHEVGQLRLLFGQRTGAGVQRLAFRVGLAQFRLAFFQRGPEGRLALRSALPLQQLHLLERLGMLPALRLEHVPLALS